MADNFGLRIGIEGEKEFKNALREINQSFKVLGSEMKLVDSQFDKQDKSMEAVTARNKMLNKELDAQKDKISTLEKALQNASDSFGENDRRTRAWTIQLNNAKAELNRMERELEQNNKALDTTGRELDYAEKEAGQFGDELKQTAAKADEASSRFQKLGGILKGVGAAMGTAFVVVGTAAVGAAKALTEMTVGAAAYADTILTQAAVTGMSVESLQAYTYAAELVDVSIETLTSSMAKQVKSMSNARDGSAKFADAYAKLGVSVADSNGRLRNSETVYWETIDALGKIANATERDALAMQIFGKSARELNPLIAQGSAGFAELTNEAKRMGAVLSEDSLNALGEFDDSVQRLKAGASAAKNVLGMVLLPQLQTLADDGVALLGDFTRGLNEAGGDFSKISTVIGNTIGGIAKMILQSLPQIMDVAVNIVLALINALAENLPLITETAGTMIFTLLEGLISALPQITQGAAQMLTALTDGIIANLPLLVQAAIDMLLSFAQGISEALPELIPSIVEAIILIANTLLANMDKILETAFIIIGGLAKGLLNALPRLTEVLPQIIITIIEFIAGNLPVIVEMGIKLIVQLAVGLIQAIPYLAASLPQITAAILIGLAGAVDSVRQIGIDIVKGLWDGIKSMGKWLSDGVGNFFGGIVSGIKNLLGIHSPSTVFAGIGTNMGEGIGFGFLNAMNGVEKEMQKAIPADFEIKAAVSGGSGNVHTVNHTGIIRVEGINSKDELTSVVDIVIDQLRSEVRI